jgi:hypothetical protein
MLDFRTTDLQFLALWSLALGLFVFGLFKDDVHKSDYTACNCKMTSEEQSVKKVEERAVAQFEVLSRCLLIGAKENQ